jgi:hypothetical protein
MTRELDTLTLHATLTPACSAKAEVFVPVAAPSGLISATISRKQT